MILAERIKQLRKERGLTQAQLAQKAGLSNGAIGNFESGKRTKISFESACRLADALDVDLEELGLERRYDLEEKMKSVPQCLDVRLDGLISAFNELNDVGKDEAVKRISELCEISRYRRW